ncbi:hypothetical protein [Plantactinospora sp. GCM10030261]|uniref:hypothetical protein n=1 Tax=Plantactinospora sp. GCM10030261 TaxID=3273420 RepID=UPI00361F309F
MPSIDKRLGGPGDERRFFETRPPDAPASRVAPKAVPVLDVTAPSLGLVSASGLARFFPAHTIHTVRATAVVDGDDCHLTQIDHYHVERVELPLDQVIRDDDVRDALRELLIAPDDRQRIAAFQDSLSRVVGTPDERGPTEVSMPVRANRLVAASDTGTLVRADGSSTTLTNEYVVNRTELPAAKVLAHDADLVRLFAHAILEPTPGARTAELLRAVLTACGRIEELALLDHATDLPRRPTILFSLFGAARVTDAATVMVGRGNTHEIRTRVDRAVPRRQDILADLSDLHEFAAPVIGRQTWLDPLDMMPEPPEAPDVPEPEPPEVPEPPARRWAERFVTSPVKDHPGIDWVDFNDL